jgi:hypothetical protein
MRISFTFIKGGKVEGVHHNHDKKKDRPHVAKGPLSR